MTLFSLLLLVFLFLCPHFVGIVSVVFIDVDVDVVFIVVDRGFGRGDFSLGNDDGGHYGAIGGRILIYISNFLFMLYLLLSFLFFIIILIYIDIVGVADDSYYFVVIFVVLLIFF